MSLINPSASRKGWQEFKQKNPSFEKSKGYKGNLGPALDQMAKLFEEIQKVEAENLRVNAKLVSLAQSYESASKIAETTLQEYEKIVTNARDAKMLAAFNAFKHTIQPSLQNGMHAASECPTLRR